MEPELSAVAVFGLVAEERNFRAAADRLGVTRSAVSQAIRRLEERLGIALVRRTTRSVSLTEAGERLYAEVAPAIADIRSAIDKTQALKGSPRGQLRLAVASIAERFLSGPFLMDFVVANPEVQLDITVTDEEVCSPDFCDRFGAPSHPAELAAYRCIGWRPGPKTPPYRWEFAEDGKEFSVAVAPEITTNDMALMIKLAIAGAGITFGMEESFRPPIERGELIPILQAYCPTFPGVYLYYPSRRNVAPKLRALVEHLKRRR